MLFESAVLKVAAQYGDYVFNAFLLYCVLPVGLCTVVGAFCGASSGLELRPGLGLGIGFVIGFCAMIVSVAWFLFISETLGGDTWMPIVIALAAAILTVILAGRVTDDAQ